MYKTVGRLLASYFLYFFCKMVYSKPIYYSFVIVVKIQ